MSSVPAISSLVFSYPIEISRSEPPIQAQPFSKEEADVVFVGAGPTGLFTAIQAKLRNPNLNIAMLEKYETYQRAHTLRLEPDAFDGILDNSELKQVIAKILKKDSFSHFTKTAHVPTLDLETGLRAYALQLGIWLDYKEVVNPRELKTDFPKAQVFVGSDGAHSKVRKELFSQDGQEFDFNKNLQYLVQAKYKIKSQPTPLNALNETFASSSSKTLAHEQVSKIQGQDEQGYQVAINFFVDEKEYQEFVQEEITFKNTLKIDPSQDDWMVDFPSTAKSHSRRFKILDDSLPCQSAVKKIEGWVKRRRCQFKDEIQGEINITATPLKIYGSRACAKIESESESLTDNHRIAWCLVGDSAGGVPFFRSLHVGYQCGSKLAEAIGESVTPNSLKDKRIEQSPASPSIDKITSCFDRYNNFATRLIKKEARQAKIKSAFISIGRYYFKFFGQIKQFLLNLPASQHLPWIDRFAIDSFYSDKASKFEMMTNAL